MRMRVRAADPTGLVLAWCGDGRCQWAFRETHAQSSFEVRETADHKGLGCFALTAYAAGDLIICEAPILERNLQDLADELAARLPDSMGATAEECDAAKDEINTAFEQLVAALPPQQRDEYMDLCMNEMHRPRAIREGPELPRAWDKTAYGVWLSNAYPTDTDPVERGAVFKSISRFNHSCLPNAHVAWSARSRTMAVHALAPITPAEEIAVVYCIDGSGDVRAARQEALRDAFGFSCACRLCSLRGQALERSEARQASIKALGRRIVKEGASQEQSALRAFLGVKRQNLCELIEQRLALLEAEGIQTNW